MPELQPVQLELLGVLPARNSALAPIALCSLELRLQKKFLGILMAGSDNWHSTTCCLKPNLLPRPLALPACTCGKKPLQTSKRFHMQGSIQKSQNLYLLMGEVSMDLFQMPY